MTINLTHQLVGYDPSTERVVVEHDIPDDRLDGVKQIVQPDPDDPLMLGCYSLTTLQTRQIASLIDERLEAEACEFFIEAHAGERQEVGMAAVRLAPVPES